MSAMADWAENEAVKYLFTAEVMGTRPSAWYLALHTGDPSDAGGSNEVFAGWYARQSVTLTRTNNSVTNSNTATFAAVTGAGLTVTHISIKDALNGGNTLAVLAVTPRVYAVGDIAAVPASSLTFSLD